MKRERITNGWKCTLSPAELSCARQQIHVPNLLERLPQGPGPASFEVKIFENADLMLTLMGLLEANDFPTVDLPTSSSVVSKRV